MCFIFRSSISHTNPSTSCLNSEQVSSTGIPYQQITVCRDYIKYPNNYFNNQEDGRLREKGGSERRVASAYCCLYGDGWLEGGWWLKLLHACLLRQFSRYLRIRTFLKNKLLGNISKRCIHIYQTKHYSQRSKQDNYGEISPCSNSELYTGFSTEMTL